MGNAECPNDELFWSWRGQFNAIRKGTLKEIRNGRPVKAIDGNGARLLLHPEVQFFFASECENIFLRGFEIDMKPQPDCSGVRNRFD